MKDTKTKKRSELSSSIMHYLYQVRNNEEIDADKMRSKINGKNKINREPEELFKAQPLSTTDMSFVAASGDTAERPLRLLNKYASGWRNPFTMPIREIDDNIRKYTGSPLVKSALIGLATGGAYYALDKYLNPNADKDLENQAMRMYEENGYKGDPHDYIESIRSVNKKKQRYAALAAGIAGFGLSEALHYKPGDMSSLWRYSNKGVRKKASMFGSGINAVSPAFAYNAIVNDNRMTALQKNKAFGMLNALGNQPITAPGLVGAAMYTGASGQTGAPLGRLAVTAVADAATGYGLGKLMGVQRPGRLAGIMGVGSLMARTMF